MRKIIAATLLAGLVLAGAGAADASTAKPRPFMASSVVTPNRLVLKGYR